MLDNERKPWDARLVEWLSRDSQTAGGSRKSTPKERAALLAIWSVYVGLRALTGGSSPWFLAYGAAVIFIAIVLLLRGRRRAR
jgi:hypothetical protein